MNCLPCNSFKFLQPVKQLAGANTRFFQDLSTHDSVQTTARSVRRATKQIPGTTNMSVIMFSVQQKQCSKDSCCLQEFVGAFSRFAAHCSQPTQLNDWWQLFKLTYKTQFSLHFRPQQCGMGSREGSAVRPAAAAAFIISGHSLSMVTRASIRSCFPERRRAQECQSMALW